MSTFFSVKVNGSLCGYFKGAKGLRQGDPLSPYLFVIAMEILSLGLSKASTVSGFRHHWKTKEQSITHLSFADDLMLYGDFHSIKILKDCLDTFSAISHMQINKTKSLYFLSHVPPSVADSIIDTLGFQLGGFPAKFLGVPLLTSKLSLADCRPLIERIVARISS